MRAALSLPVGPRILVVAPLIANSLTRISANSTYFGWYRGDTIDYFQERRAAYGLRAQAQPFTFTECVGSYLTAGGDTDVGGKNYACDTDSYAISVVAD